MNDENPYESPQTIDTLKETQSTEGNPKLANVGAILMFVCLGLFMLALILVLIDAFFTDQSHGKPPIDSYISLKYGMPVLKIGCLSGVIGMLLITAAFTIRWFNKRYLHK
jgi:hypothetical protein